METPCGILLREFFCDFWYVSRSKFERVGGPRIIFIICNHTQSLIAILFKIKFYDFLTLGYIKKCKKKIKKYSWKKKTWFADLQYSPSTTQYTIKLRWK